ncbi:MAG: hypothetical protein H6981_14740 [Gammaproteobacteria bacterium]|nr:hypothetical protein [Gammaproteobacteria bacterium]MCP5138041.1 hypothetical protein [Gammaproteobacteria bacterium]
MEALLITTLLGIGSYFVLIILTGVLRPVVFSFQPLFWQLNRLQWFITNPFRGFWKRSTSNKPRGFFLAASVTGFTLLWFLTAYLINFPLRVIGAIYYDVILFSAVSFSDNIQEFLHPQRGKLGHQKGGKYFWLYLVTLPWRFGKLLIRAGLYVTDSLLMFAVSIVFPTLTMLHGTRFREAGTKITQSGDWLVGSGNYAGTGIYFGMDRRTAEYYAPKGENSSLILARVTLTFTKTIATLKEADRNLVGLGESGETLAKRVKGFYASVEHWRDLGWWEYCLLKPGRRGQYISSWRIRPVALINNDKIVRTYGGFAHYTLSTGLVAGLFSWAVILAVAINVA